MEAKAKTAKRDNVFLITVCVIPNLESVAQMQEIGYFCSKKCSDYRDFY